MAAAGEDEIVEGPPAVPQGRQDALEGVVHDDGRRPGEIPAEVGLRLGQDAGVRAHPAQDVGGQQHPHPGEEQAAEEAEEHVGVDGLADPVPILGPEVPGDHHPRAGGRPVEEADEQVDQRPRGADGGQGLLAQEVAHDDGVGGVVELLEELAQK